MIDRLFHLALQTERGRQDAKPHEFLLSILAKVCDEEVLLSVRCARGRALYARNMAAAEPRAATMPNINVSAEFVSIAALTAIRDA